MNAASKFWELLGCKICRRVAINFYKKVDTHSHLVEVALLDRGVALRLVKNVELTEFGGRVSALRIIRGLSQQQLANKTGMHRTYIGGVERGERNISLLNIHKLAVALGVVAIDLAPAVVAVIE